MGIWNYGHSTLFSWYKHVRPLKPNVSQFCALLCLNSFQTRMAKLMQQEYLYICQCYSYIDYDDVLCWYCYSNLQDVRQAGIISHFRLKFWMQRKADPMECHIYRCRSSICVWCDKVSIEPHKPMFAYPGIHWSSWFTIVDGGSKDQWCQYLKLLHGKTAKILPEQMIRIWEISFIFRQTDSK